MHALWLKLVSLLIDQVETRLTALERQSRLQTALLKKLLAQTVDPAQAAALGDEIAQLEASAAQVEAGMAANP